MNTGGHGYSRYLVLSGGAHAALLATLIGLSMVHGCAHPLDNDNLPHELIIDIPDLGQQDAPPAPLPPAPTPKAEPEVHKEEPPEAPPDKDDVVIPAPDNKKKDVRKTETRKDDAKKPESTHKIEVSRKLVRRPSNLPKATTTRKSKLTPEEIARLIDRGATVGKRSTLSDDDLRRILNTDTKFGKGSPISQEQLYYEMVRQILHRAWDQPGSLGVVGLVTRVELTVAPDGRILSSRMVGGSGNAVMDNSVMQAVRSVPRLTGVPGDFLSSHQRITVAFELTGDG